MDNIHLRAVYTLDIYRIRPTHSIKCGHGILVLLSKITDTGASKDEQGSQPWGKLDEQGGGKLEGGSSPNSLRHLAS